MQQHACVCVWQQGTVRVDDVDAVIEQTRAEGELKEAPYLPLVVQDPGTKKKSLLVSPYLVHDIEGMSRADSRKFLGELTERCIDVQGVYR